MWTSLLFGSLLGLLAFYIFWRSLLFVRQGEHVVVERLGRFYDVRKEGLHWGLFPLLYAMRCVRWSREIEKPGRNGVSHVETEWFTGYRIHTVETMYDMLPKGCITRDQVPVEVNLVIYYQVTDVKRVVYDIDDLWRAIQNDLETGLTTIVTQMESRDLSVQAIHDAMMQRMNKETWGDAWGIKLTRVLIQNITYEKKYLESITAMATLRARTEAESMAAITTRKKEMEDLLYQEKRLAKEREMTDAAISHEVAMSQKRVWAEREREETIAKSKAACLEIEQGMANRLKEDQMTAKKRTGLSEDYWIAELHAQSWQHLNQRCSTMIVPMEYTQLLTKQNLIRESGHDAKMLVQL
jgi:regulator of protease activity HflC (stomatin/prohibitin superfamily)